jgi:hypothetical protein
MSKIKNKSRSKSLSIKKLNNLATSYFVSGHIVKNEFLCISAFISFVASQRNIPTLGGRPKSLPVREKKAK